MKTLLLLCVLMMTVGVAGCNSSRGLKPGQHEQKLARQVTLEMDYLLFLPEDYGSVDKQWPMILFLHGAGERGSDLDLVKVHGPPKIVAQQKDFPFILVSPQCPADNWWPLLTETLIALVDEIQEKYDVDPARVYLTGLSMGGFGTWSLISAYPERFAAIAPICGGGQPYLAGRIKDVPTWVFHGAKDPVVPARLSEEMVEAINRAGGNAKLTIYPEADHDSWTVTYNNSKLYDWFLEHVNPNVKSD